MPTPTPLSLRAQSYRARLLAALNDRDGVDITPDERIQALEDVTTEIEQRIGAAYDERQFEDAETPVVDEEPTPVDDPRRR